MGTSDFIILPLMEVSVKSGEGQGETMQEKGEGMKGEVKGMSDEMKGMGDEMKGMMGK
jgi:hypothetical protein